MKRTTTCADWPAPLPSWVTIGRAGPRRLLNLSQLPSEEKQATWQQIRERAPALAALLQDPTLQALREAFDADICIDNSEIEE